MKKATSFPQWKGFENSPDGCLLDQVIDLKPGMGFAYERSCEYYKDFHTHDRLMLVCPRGASAMEVRTRNPNERIRIDSSSILLVPKNLEHDDEGVSCIYDTMALYPTTKLVAAAAKKLGLSQKQLDLLSTKCLKIKRHPKLDQLTQEFFYEKVLGPADEVTLEYLGSKIICEVLRTLFPDSENQIKDKKALGKDSIAVKALQFIESNLFAPLELDQIAKQAGASVSTLLRKFKSEIKQTPYAYIKARRLEEAFRLLKNGEHPVGEVALLVGYENFGAFTEAFKAKYGQLPSEIKY